MSEIKNSCQEYHLLINKLIDGEINRSERENLDEHLKDCPECRKTVEKLKNIKMETEKMKKNFIPEMAWEEYWNHLYNRMERGIGWMLLSVGAIILLGYGAYHFVINVIGTSDLSGLQKLAILAVVLGGVILFVSVVREKLLVRKHDKYKEIKR